MPTQEAALLPPQWLVAGDCLPLAITVNGSIAGATVEWLFAARSKTLALTAGNGGLAAAVTVETINGEEVTVTRLAGELHEGWTSDLGGQQVDHALRLTDSRGHQITLLRGVYFIAHTSLEGV